MTKEEEAKLELLLKQYYPSASQLNDKNRILAWHLALEKYPYDEIKAALIAHVTKSKFFPFIQELTGNITLPEDKERHIENWREKMEWAATFLERSAQKKSEVVKKIPNECRMCERIRTCFKQLYQ